MNNKSPLLNFKENCINPQNEGPEDAKYDLELGYWICEDGKPLITRMIESTNESLIGQTTKTATRESIDQAESVFGQTTLTKTREGADQTESSSTIFAQTMITETGESVDRAEKAS